MNEDQEESLEGQEKYTGTRYHLSTKLAAVTAFVQGEKKRDIIARVGCMRNVLDLWIKKYEEVVIKNIAEEEAGGKQLKEEKEAVRAAAEVITTATDNRPLAQRRRRSDGSLDLTEEERKLILLCCRVRGRQVVSVETEINVSTLNRWLRWFRKTGATQKSLAMADLPIPNTDRIYILREQLNLINSRRYELDREYDAIKKAIEILEAPPKFPEVHLF